MSADSARRAIVITHVRACVSEPSRLSSSASSSSTSTAASVISIDIVFTHHADVYTYAFRCVDTYIIIFMYTCICIYIYLSTYDTPPHGSTVFVYLLKPSTRKQQILEGRGSLWMGELHPEGPNYRPWARYKPVQPVRRIETGLKD